MKLNTPLTKYEEDLVEDYQETLRRAKELENKLIESSKNLGNVTATVNINLPLMLEITSDRNSEITKSILIKDYNNPIFKDKIYKKLVDTLIEYVDKGLLKDIMEIEG